MRIDEDIINNNAVRLIQTALDTYLFYADDTAQRPDATNVFIGQVSGVLTMAKVSKEVLKT